jgi:ribulose-phosphate 3-epimerase
MKIVPAINAPDFAKAQELIVKAVKFLPPADSWLHIDVGDGQFSSIKTWGNPGEFLSLKVPVNAEIHLMAQDALTVAHRWLPIGIQRLIVHLEKNNNLDLLIDLCRRWGVECMLAISPQTGAEELMPYFPKVSAFQILAVNPGRTGQKFQEEALGKTRFLREHCPDAKIEVDGGVNLRVAQLVKKSGADFLVSASYIFNNENPAKAYQELSSV